MADTCRLPVFLMLSASVINVLSFGYESLGLCTFSWTEFKREIWFRAVRLCIDEIGGTCNEWARSVMLWKVGFDFLLMGLKDSFQLLRVSDSPVYYSLMMNCCYCNPYFFKKKMMWFLYLILSFIWIGRSIWLLYPF